MPLRIAAFVTLGLAYVLGSHWLMTRAPDSPWAAVGLLGPMLIASALGALQAGQRWLAALLFSLTLALCAVAVFGLRAPVPLPLLYLGQHVAINVTLGLWFAGTLRDGAKPLISVLAETVHGFLTPEMARYTRNVTRAWVVYFAAMAGLSVLLYGTVSFDAWATFANLLTPLAVGAMFVGERLLRYRLHPAFERSSMADAVRAYMQMR